MFYRQKILLAMTEVTGRSIGSTDMQKLLFLYCKETQENYYDFFPYKFGAFSFLSYFDKRKLIEKGYLKDVSHFELNTNDSYIVELKSKDRTSIKRFATRNKTLRGNMLVRKTYLEYPEYASRSTIATRVLSEQEYINAQKSWNRSVKPTLFTIGYEGSTIDDYIYRLTVHNVKLLIDVRRNPLSRKHGFSKKSMKNYLGRVGIQYHHIPELGIASNLRQNLSSEAAYADLFDLYAATILPNQTDALDNVKEFAIEHNRVALTCFEADHCMCHRHKISDVLDADPTFDFPIVHI